MKTSLKRLATLGALAFGVSVALPTLAQSNATPGPGNNPPGSYNTPGSGAPGSTDTGVPGVNTNSPNNNIQTPGPGQLTPAPIQSSSGTIDAIVRTSPSFELFNALLRVADSEGILSAELADEDFTVFAPTDEALAALPPGTFKALVQPENRDLLASVLENHIVEGKVTSSDLSSKQIRSMGGTSLAPVGGQGTLAIANARIIGPDIQAENGVIHAVDQLIITPDVQSRLGSLTPVAPTSPASPSVTPAAPVTPAP